MQKQLTQHDKKIVIAKDSYDKLLKQYEKFQEDFDKKSTKAEEKINMLLSSVNKLETDNSRLRTQRVQLEADIADLQKQLAGVIVCPKCQHEFTLANDIDINDVKLKLQDRKGESQDILNSIETNERSIAEITAEGRKARQEQDRLNNCKIEWSTKITETCTALDELSRGASSLANKMQALQNQMNILQNQLKKYVSTCLMMLMQYWMKPFKDKSLKLKGRSLTSTMPMVLFNHTRNPFTTLKTLLKRI